MYQDPELELFLKTEQLLYLRQTFALAGLVLFLAWGCLANPDFSLAAVELICAFAAIYPLVALVILAQGGTRGQRKLASFNGILIILDIIALSALVYATRPLDSDFYFLYLLPILLASHVFDRRGILLTVIAVSISYIGILIASNTAFLPFLVGEGKRTGLSFAYAQKLWAKLFTRSAIIVSTAFIWGVFCEHMKSMARQGSNRLAEQLNANTRLACETIAHATREQLVNSISTAIRNTLELSQILKASVCDLRAALGATSATIICSGDSKDMVPPIWHDADPSLQLGFDPEFCAFVLATFANQSNDGTKRSFVFNEPIREWSLRQVREDLSRLEMRSLVVQPIMYGLDSVGVLLIGQSGRRRQWSNFELELIKAVAGQIAIAIEHARLVGELSEKNKDLVLKNLHLDAKNLELRTMQSQLIHQEKMASLGRMVAGIAHELNNPVNFVYGNLPYLQAYFADLQRIIAACDSIPVEYRAKSDQLKTELKYSFLITDLEHIIADLKDGAERIRQIIKNLRSFSRLDEAELKEASICEGIESSIKILSQYYGRDKIPLKAQIADIPPVLCYPGSLNQVWVNLLSNAAQAAHLNPKPKVEISAQVEESNWVVVSIGDNGPGIKLEDQSKIFEPFFTTKPVGQGTGLGLSICHSIIERHGGQIWFETSQGEGTTFKVKIPLSAKVTLESNPQVDPA